MTDGWKEIPRLAVTALILLLFAYAIFVHYTVGLEETLKNIVLLAVGFWLGSSRGAQAQTDNVSKALDVASQQGGVGQAAQETAEAAQKKADQLSGK